MAWPNRRVARRRASFWDRLWILYWVLLAVYVLTLVPAIGHLRLWPGVTLQAGAHTVVTALAWLLLARIAVAIYWRACRTQPPAWWQRTIPAGVLLAGVGLAGAGLVALAHARIGDAIGVPLYVSGLALSVLGLGVFAAGNVGLMRAIRRQQRQAAEHTTNRLPPPTQ